jgi:hypothetical protein
MGDFRIHIGLHHPVSTEGELSVIYVGLLFLKIKIMYRNKARLISFISTFLFLEVVLFRFKVGQILSTVCCRIW